MEETILNPCPVCGGIGKLQRKPFIRESSIYIVICNKCGSYSEPFDDVKLGEDYHRGGNPIQQTVKSWNSGDIVSRGKKLKRKIDEEDFYN